MTSAKVARINKHPGVMADPTKELDDGQRGRVLELVKADPQMSLIRALREAGVVGSKGHLHSLVDDGFAEEIRLARGWNIVEVEATTWAVALNTEHPSWDRANARLLKAYLPQFRDKVDYSGQVGGRVEVTVEHDHESAVRILRKLADVGLIQPGPAAVGDAAEQRVLPAPAD